MSDRIDLSIVIACNRPRALSACLAGLADQESNARFEVIAVGNVNGVSAEEHDFNLVLIPCAESHTNFRRNLGIIRTCAPRIGFLDDDAVPESSWVKAAVTLDPDSNRVLTGPETPLSSGPTSALVFGVCQNILAEGTRAHVNNCPETVSWSEVPFCNCVVPKWLFDVGGRLATDVPWDLDDFEFFFRLRCHAVFKNVPELAIRHDRYPDAVGRFLAYKWKQRVRTGEKIVSYPHLYARIPAVVLCALLPWVSVSVLILLPVPATTVVTAGLLIYGGLVVSQAGIAFRCGGLRQILIYLSLMVMLHAVTVIGVQLGLVRSLLGRVILRRSAIARIK
ncbi:hypothetical protein MYX82_00280 [Acidobacteria bacterium AH-259-D05]|nr:hypothetical protein [Acidobacteria bacterium AH-259-D05]